VPELPEVETIRTGLSKHLTNQTVSAFTLLWPNSVTPGLSLDSLIGHTVTSFRRFGKLLVIDFTDDLSLMAHLRMTGQLILSTPTAPIPTLPDRTTRATLSFTSSATLFFNDQRKFGRLTVLPTPEVLLDPFVTSLGPDPTDPSFSTRVLTQALAHHPGLSVKAALLDQHTLAGIGNIYADEALFAARIHPSTPVSALTTPQRRALATAIPAVLNRALSLGGSTSRNYLNALGQRGAYLDTASVYGRAGLPCHSCGTPLAKFALAGRGTSFCPRCQRLR
jgi:formamidopyrimidine-DNA glycosylase